MCMQKVTDLALGINETANKEIPSATLQEPKFPNNSADQVDPTHSVHEIHD